MIKNNRRSAAKNHKTKVILKPIPGIDTFRAFIFPNNIREYRKKNSIGSLLQLAQRIGSITYIRLSKIERGEIFARTDELRAIGAALGVDPAHLLVDIDDRDFDIAEWAAEFLAPENVDPKADSVAVMLAAALRARRAADGALTITALEVDYGIAPVILSRIENAYKPIDRWNADIQQALFRLFGVAGVPELEAYLVAAHAKGELDEFLPLVANPETRNDKTRAKVQTLRDTLEQETAAPPRGRGKAAQPVLAKPPLGEDGPVPADDVLDTIHASDSATIRLLPVFGAPLNDGLVARIATGEQVEGPRNAGPRAYGLRICRPTLGSGLPGRSIVVVDPDRFPSAGGLAVIQEKQGLRLLSVTFDRQGRMLGYSEHPDREIAIDDIDPEHVAAVLSAQFE